MKVWYLANTYRIRTKHTSSEKLWKYDCLYFFTCSIKKCCFYHSLRFVCKQNSEVSNDFMITMRVIFCVLCFFSYFEAFIPRSLKSLVQDFKDLSEICLLLLHLEVRVHCFYYLLPVAKQVSESLESWNVLCTYLSITSCVSSKQDMGPLPTWW